MKRRTWLLLLIGVGLALVVMLPASAAAQSISGRWSCVETAGGTCEFTLSQSGSSLSGRGKGNGYTWPITGNISGRSFTMKMGPFDQLPSYTANYTGTLAADGNSMSGTYSDGGGGKPFKYARLGAAAGGCTDARTLLVTCADPRGQPGVCGPTGTIFPQCSHPTVLPVVCGPSGTLLAPCQAQGPVIVACGGFGTILPQCNLPPVQLPQVCGPTGSLLPPCKGANNPVTVCGPSGTVLPECRFSTRISAEPLNLNQEADSKGDPGSGDVEVVVGCGAKTSRAGAAQVEPCSDPLTVTFGSWVGLQRGAVAQAARDQAASLAIGAPGCYRTDSQFCNGQVVNEDIPLDQLNKLARANADAFVTRSTNLFEAVFSKPPGTRLPADVGNRPITQVLLEPFGTPRYFSPRLLTSNIYFESAANAMKTLFEGIRYQHRNVVVRKPTKRSSASARAAARAPKLRVVRKRIRLKPGKRKRVRLVLTSKQMRRLGGKAALRRKRFPMRVIVSYKGPRGAVARVVDIRVKVKPRKRKRR